MVKKNFPQVKLISNRTNLGFGKANNQGIKRSKGDYVLFLNSDTIILERAIDKCLKLMEEKKEIDILGCKLLNEDQSLQPSGGFFPKLRQIFYLMFFIDDLPVLKRLINSYQEKKPIFYQKLRPVDWLTGAFLIVKKEVVENIGGFDEDFFMYAEEVDFCYRAKKEGFGVWFYPDAKVIHLKGKSSARGFEKSILGEYQGLIKFYEKHQAKREMPMLKLLLRLGSLLRIAIFGILNKQRKREVYEEAYQLV